MELNQFKTIKKIIENQLLKLFFGTLYNCLVRFDVTSMTSKRTKKLYKVPKRTLIQKVLMR